MTHTALFSLLLFSLAYANAENTLVLLETQPILFGKLKEANFELTLKTVDDSSLALTNYATLMEEFRESTDVTAITKFVDNDDTRRSIP